MEWIKDLPEGFLSRFQKIVFPGFTEEELINIVKGLAEKENMKIKKKQIIKDLLNYI